MLSCLRNVRKSWLGAVRCFAKAAICALQLVATDHISKARAASIMVEPDLGHTGFITSAAFSPDRRYMASASGDGEIKLWSFGESGKPVLEQDLAVAGVRVVAYADDRRILMATTGGSVILYDLVSKAIVQKWTVDQNVVKFLIDSHGYSVIAMTGVTHVYVISLINYKLFSLDGMGYVTFSGRQVYCLRASDNKAFLVDPQTKRRLATRQLGAAVFTADGLMLYRRDTASRIGLFRSKTDTLVRVFDLTIDDDYSISISPNGSHVSVIGSNTYKVWDSASGRTVLAGQFDEEGRRLGVLWRDDDSLWLLGEKALLTLHVSVGSSSQTPAFYDALAQDYRRIDSYAFKEAPLSFFRDPDLRTFVIKRFDFNERPEETHGGLISNAGTLVAGSELIPWYGDVQNIEISVHPEHGMILIVDKEASNIKIWSMAKKSFISECPFFRPGVWDFYVSSDNEFLLAAWPHFQIWNIQNGKQVVQSLNFGSGDWTTINAEGYFNTSSLNSSHLRITRGAASVGISNLLQSLYRPDLVRAKLAGDPDGKVKAAAAKLDLTKVVESGAEPEVKFAVGDGDVPDKTQDVAVAVTDGGGGIGKVEWRVNGVTQGIDEGAVARSTALDEDGDPKPSGRTVDLHRTLQLEPGANKIEVVAYNAAGLIASDPVSITLTRKGEQAAESETTTPRLFVLAVGINEYFDGRLRLAYAVPDAKALADGFRQAGSGLYSEVSVTTLLNQDVTMAKLDATFAELGQKMKPSDVFVFFIAGHGKTVDGHYHFIPYDFRYQDAQSILTGGIDQDHFQAWLARIPARKSLMLTDTCESGSLTEDPMRVASRGLEQVEAQNAAIELLTRAVGRTVLSASTDDAPALEGYRGHGVFSYALLDALSHAQAGSDGFITVTSLAGFVDQRVQDVSYKAFHIRQIPQMKVVGSNFPVAHRLAAALVSEDGEAETAAAAASDGAAIAARPTHVVIAPVTVRATADAAGAPVTDLAPGTQVTLVQTANGWTVVARDGKRLGYVKADALARMQ